MPVAYDELDNYMHFVIFHVIDRTAGIALLHFNVLTTRAYWEDPRARSAWGNYTVKILVDRTGRPVAPYYGYRVDGVHLGEGWDVSIQFVGQTPGINTLVARYQFWKLYVVSAVRINLRNRLAGVTGQAFVPIAQRHGILSEHPVVPTLPSGPAFEAQVEFR